MGRIPLVAVLVWVFTPQPLLAQSVTLQNPGPVVSADDFATRAFQDPWDMNERTDFGWFLYGADFPVPDLANVSFSGGIFSAQTATSPNVFLLETGNPFAARVGKFGTNYPINANHYRLIAIRMYLSGGSQGSFVWNRETLYDGATSQSGPFQVTPGWRTYFIDLPTLGGSPIPWGGTIKSLQFYPSFGAVHQLQIDWVRLVNVDQSLCRRVTWSGLGGAVDLYLDADGATNGNESLLAENVSTNSASLGCQPTGSGVGYNFYAGGLAPGAYFVLARPHGTSNTLTRSSSSYTVNAIPTLNIVAPSEEGSTDDFATTQLGNAWDMNALSDVDQFFNVSNPSITTINAETSAGLPLPNTRVLWGTSTQAPPPAGDPIVSTLWHRGAATRIDPLRYRILTVEFGLPNAARAINAGSVARIVWRVAGDDFSVSDDIIFNSRVGTNVMHKLIVDMADRDALRIDEGSTIGWVPGSAANPGIDIFRFDVHEFPNPVAFYVKRIKLAAFERVAPGANYTIRWTSSEASGTVTLYYDTDQNPANGRTLIGSTAVSATTGSRVWTAPGAGAYFISADFSDGQNVNTAYSRWPVIVGLGTGGSPTTPAGLRVIR